MMSQIDRLPRLGGPLFLGDGGLETTMIFHEGIELPEFASFRLLSDEAGRAALRRYYMAYIDIARRHRAGFTLDTPTWRANADWGERIGYSAADLAGVNRAAVEFAEEIRAVAENDGTPIAVCGTIGPRADAYHPASAMSAADAQRYHAVQIGTFGETTVDMVSAYTLAYAAEATGIVRAARAIGMPVSVSFTVETDGRLPSGQSLAEAIGEVDAETDRGAAYFMINCAHPTHVSAALGSGGAWLERVGGVRPNASRKSHAELDSSPALDSGDPEELARAYKALKPHLHGLAILGGCCGTDQRHVERICIEWLEGGRS
jgi:S-methylmethionine-dependent homocysteine/selenocysteine methylase